MRCPSCGQDADPANALCPYCHTALHIPAAPTSPYAGGPGPYGQGPPPHGQGPVPHGQGPPPYGQGPPPHGGHEYNQAPYTPPPAPWPDQGPAPGGYGPGGYGPGYGQPDGGWPSGNYQILEPGAPPERPRSPLVWLVVGIAVVLLTAGGVIAFVKLTGRHPTVPVLGSSGPPATTGAPPTTTRGSDAKAQANAIDQLLNASSASRQKLSPALTAVDNCADMSGAITTLQQVTTERDTQVQQSQSLVVDQLQNGAQLRSTLTQALTFSLQADQKFTAWAQAVAQTGCPGQAPHEDNYAAAQAASASATTSKQQFVALWNPVAATYGLPTRTESTV